MAAPEKIHIKNLTGKWVMNKTLSDPFDPVLALQGIGWFTRTALSAATVTQHLHESDGNASSGTGTTATEIVIDQFITGGIKGSTERRVLDWSYRSHADRIFGDVKGRSRYATLGQISEESQGKGVVEEDAKFLVEGWLAETLEGDVVESYVENEGRKWTAWQVWGFAEVGGVRRLTRRFAVRKMDRDEVVRVKLVYDWAGELEK